MWYTSLIMFAFSHGVRLVLAVRHEEMPDEKLKVVPAKACCGEIC
jgi:hypothetical protein